MCAIMEQRIRKSLWATAMMARILCLPLAMRRSRKARNSGHQREALVAARKIRLRRCGLPCRLSLERLMEVPDCSTAGTIPA